MTRRVISLLLFVVAVGLSAAACKQEISPDSYSVGSVGQVNRVVRGIIISARQVEVSGTSGVGSVAGAGAGGVAGSTIGGSVEANIIGAIAGAVVGGVAGALAEEAITDQIGMEYVIETGNGSLITIVQGEDKPLQIGDNVLVMYGQQSRVILDPSAQ